VRSGIRSGRLAPGTRLPGTRELARELGVSRGVAVEAYAQLTAEGYLTTARGAGSVVAAGATPAPSPLADAPARLVPAVGPHPAYHFHPGIPDLAAFPRAAWQRSLRAALRSAPDAALGYGPVTGAEPLRESLAHYLGRARGVVAEPQRVVVTSGLTQGLALICRLLRARGARRVAMEDPGFLEHRMVVRHHGLEAVPVRVDDQGLQTAELERLDADAVVVTPAHQAPLGVVLAPERRTALLAWAQRRDALVFEDDYDAEYRYDRGPIGALQGLAPDRVVYAGSASKVLAPGVRLGWLVAPAGLVDELAREKRLDDVGSPVLDQLALADFLARGELDRHLRRMRPHYRQRRDALAAALAERLPQVRLGGIAAGLHAVALLPWETDEAALVAAARQRGVILHPLGDARFHTRSGPPGLWLGYGNLAPPALARGVGALAEAYAEVTVGAGAAR
jgi:GntR family transcriptional regulator/MocR family aminotransferase